MQQPPPPQYNYSDSPYSNNATTNLPQTHQSRGNSRQQRATPPYVRREVPEVWRQIRNGAIIASVMGVLIIVVGLLLMTVNTYLSFPLVSCILVFVGAFLWAGAFLIHVFADRQWSGRYFSYIRRSPAQQNRYYNQQQSQMINQGMNSPYDQQYNQPYVYAQKTSNY